MKTVSFIQYKGGVGKTTAAALLCKILAAAGYRVLAIDLDRHQYHLSSLLGGSTSPVICSNTPKTIHASDLLSNLLFKTTCNTLDYVTLCDSLCDWNTNDAFQLRKRFAFFNFLAWYDYIVIDTPPGFGKIHELAMNASDHIVLPIDLSWISISSIGKFFMDFQKGGQSPAKSYSILHNFVSLSVNNSHTKQLFPKTRENHVLSHFLYSDEHVRAITSGRSNFLSQHVPKSIISQIIAMAVDILHADTGRLQSIVDSSGHMKFEENRFDHTVLTFDNMVTA